MGDPYNVQTVEFLHAVSMLRACAGERASAMVYGGEGNLATVHLLGRLGVAEPAEPHGYPDEGYSFLVGDGEIYVDDIAAMSLMVVWHSDSESSLAVEVGDIVETNGNRRFQLVIGPPTAAVNPWLESEGFATLPRAEAAA
jgi:hypothetical protein